MKFKKKIIRLQSFELRLKWEKSGKFTLRHRTKTFFNKSSNFFCFDFPENFTIFMGRKYLSTKYQPLTIFLFILNTIIYVRENPH